MIKTALARLLLGALFILLIGSITFLALPFIVNRFIIPPLLEKTGFSAHQIQITRLSPYSAVATLELGSSDRPLLSLPRLELRFTPRSLLEKRINELIVEHGLLHLFRQGNRLVLALPEKPSDSREIDTTRNIFLLPLGVESIVFDQCSVIVHDRQTSDLHVGVSGQIEPVFQAQAGQKKLQAVSGTFRLSDDLTARVALSADFGEVHHRVQATIHDATPALPEQLLPEYLRGLKFTGLNADLDLNLAASSHALIDYQFTGELRQAHFTNRKLTIRGGGPDESIRFSFSGGPTSHTYEISSVVTDLPFAARAAVTGTGSYTDSVLHASGEIRGLIADDDPADVNHQPLTLGYDGRWSADSGYQVELSATYRSEHFPALFADLVLSGPSDIKFLAKLGGEAGQFTADFSLDSAPLAASHSNLQLTTSDLHLTGRLQRLADNTTLRLAGSMARVSLPEYDVVLQDIGFDLPVDFGFSGPGLPQDGALSINQVLLKGHELFSLKTSIRQDGPDFISRGSLNAPSAPDIKLTFEATGSIQDRSAALSWSMPPVMVDQQQIQRLALISLPASMSLEGLLESRGMLLLSDGRLSGSLDTSISNAKLEISDKNISLTGIDCRVFLPRLPEIASAPSQRCRAEKIDVSTLHFRDAELVFRVEDPQTLFIEKSRLSWAGGSLESGSLRFSRDIMEIDTTLYASRIRLAELLSQFGFKGTEGEGSVNGRLPVRLRRNSIEFDDGFLFSTPGTGGIVRFSDTDLLRQGMGSIGEAGYINYSLMSLEDFTYNWTKLSFNSSGGELLMTLELDGKPSTPLPFGFKDGRLVETAKGEGLQYPIRLDVNFRLPLAELFQMGQSINSIMGNN